MLEQRDAHKFGIDIVDELLQEEAPKSIVTLLLGDPGSGKSIFCKQFLYHGLQASLRGIYVAFDETREEVLASTKKLGWNLKQYEDNKQLLFVDCTGMNPSDINSLNIRLTETFEKARGSGEVRIVFDSITALLSATREARLGIDFVRLLNAKMKSYGFSAICTLNRQGLDKTTIALIKDISDGIIEMKMEEEEKTLRTYLRILKMKDTDHSRRWIPYTVDKTTGIRFYIPKIVMIGPPGAGKSSLKRFLLKSEPGRPLQTISVGTYSAEIITGQSIDSGLIKQMRASDIAGIVLVIDSSAPETFFKALDMLRQLETSNLPRVIFANKQDLTDAITPQNLIDDLGLKEPIPIIGTIATEGTGVEEGLRTILRLVLKTPV